MLSSANSLKRMLSESLFEDLQKRFGVQINTLEPPKPIVPWAESVLLDGRPFSLKGHEYQRGILECTAPRQVFLKGAQLGVTSIQMLKTMHGLIAGFYVQGVLYLFPSRNDVLDFARGRFNPLVDDNPDAIGKHIQDTDAASIKRVGRALLYLRGARSTSKVGGTKRTSSQLKSIPVDAVVFDEADEMDPAMVELAVERMSHSLVKQETYLSTPTIPDFGVDKLFQQSDQRYWFLKCRKCGKETCLELTFPECLHEDWDGSVIRFCQHCRDAELHPEDGTWRALYPDRAKDMIGWRISQLNSMFIDPGKILQLYQDPPNGNLSEVMNSKLAQAHIEAENRLDISQVLSLCGNDPMSQDDSGPTYLGADIGKLIHVVIGRRDYLKGTKVLFVGAVETFRELADLMTRFRVSKAVIDAMPETRKSREFVQNHRGRAFMCYYSEHRTGSYGWNEGEWIVSANRTEALDAAHHMLSKGKVQLPSRSSQVEEFAAHCANTARILHTDDETGASKYKWVQTGPDHYFHAFSYMNMGLGEASNGFFADLIL